LVDEMRQMISLAIFFCLGTLDFCLAKQAGQDLPPANGTDGVRDKKRNKKIFSCVNKN